MNNEDLKKIIQAGLSQSEASVEGDGYHYQLKVISPVFMGLNKVKRQQKVYQLLNELITSGELHAISIIALTPEEKLKVGETV